MNPLERLWKDKMSIYRYVDETINGVTKSKEKLIAENIKCKYSKGSLSDIGEEVPSIENSYTVFCGLDVDIMEGDKIVVTQSNGRIITLRVGEGFPYSKHQEFTVKRDDKA
ncbi:hypothetical protein [Clostridium sp.]|uniref:hypothetical protein n=1 Tax=Clostridium sp. TaxID=1506 RepID=UPI0025B88AFF|nr:hypothetical protein [Clostridium sp.]MBS4958414.1 hypothetical protein [Clostridium sp.]MDU3526418.1 hypothetical protein [Clostridium sp.]